MKWECIAVTLDEVQQFIGTMQKSRDPNEKILRDRLVEHLVPILEKQEEARRKKAAQRERELLILAKLATAKRSSRIASRAEAQRQEEEARAEAERRRAEAEAARKEKSLRMKLEREREARLLAREKRAKEREAKRAEQQEALARLAEEEMHDEEGGRTSSRLLKAEIDKRRRLLEELDEEEEEWIFDCVCGVYGKVDDGTHSISCERCNVWLHSKCVGISEEQAERDEFHFVCPTCLRREEAAKMEAAREEARLAAEREAAQREAEEAVNRTETTTMETEAGRIEAEEKAKAKRAQLAAAAAARRKKNAEKRAAEEAAARAAAIAAGEKPKFRVKFIKPHSLSGPGDAGNSAGSVPLASLPIQKISIPAPATAAPTIPAATAQPTPVVGTPQNLGPVAGPTAPASSSAPTKVTIYPAVHPVSLSNPAVPGAPPAANGSSRPQAKLPPVDEEKANGIFNKKAPDLKPAQVAIGGPQVQLPVKHSAPPTHPLPATWNSSPGLTGLHSPSNPPHDPGTGLSPESSPYSRSNPFSSAHPTIAPPEQSPRKARAYESIQDLSSSPPRIPNGYVYTQETPQISQDVMSHAQQGVDPPVLEADGQPAVASTMDDNGATSGPLYLANGQTPPATAGLAGDDPTRTYNLLSGSAQGPPQELQQDFGSPVKQ